jgi:hypothetical protein
MESCSFLTNHARVLLHIAGALARGGQMAAVKAWRALPLEGTVPGGGGLAAWAEASGRRRPGGPVHGGLRFAFYGRVSTEDWQDPESFLARQLGQAEALVRGHGKIVAKFSDTGESRTVAWGRRPQAATLVAALADPDRGWDALWSGSTSGRSTAANTRWSRRCCSITRSSCGCRRQAAGSISRPSTTSGR